MAPDDDKTRTHVVLSKGTMVGHYRIIEKIGAGGMGEVYLAEDTELDRQVALKFLPPHLCQDEDCRARFKREAQAGAKLDHPNIVTIHEVSEYRGRPFFAMQLVEGQSLRELSKGKDISVDRIIELAIQICDGLSAAHEQKVIHRDIKPSNIVIDAYGRPKILDFGLAAIQGGEQLTKTGSTLGTVRYMSPEQVQGQKVDHRSDLFSLGIVLYELIAGRTPFERDNEAATLKAITQDNPEPLARYKSDVPDEFQRTVSKLLEKDPSMRYQTSGGVISDLKRLITPTQSSMAVAPAKQKSRWPLAIVGFVIIAALVVVGIKFWPVSESVMTEPSIPERKMLAVLPFENLGSPEDEYFADGLTEEITSKLGVVSELGVISRTSAMLYKNTDKDLPEIAAELGVDYIIEGTVRWDKTGDTSMVRITPQLIRVSDNTHLWAENYERPLTRIFSVQADIATSIVANLDITLLQPQRDALVDRPTKNMEAYTYYLKGVGYCNDGELELAEQMILKSISLDTTFAEAYAEYSYINSYQYFYPYQDLNNNDNDSGLAKIYAQKAFEMNPESPHTLRALGFYSYYVEGEYEKALDFYERGLKYEPNDSKLLYSIGKLNFRASRYEKGYNALKEASIIDPGNSNYSLSLAHICLFLRKGEEAITILNKALDFNPDNLRLNIWKVMIASHYFGSPSMVKEAINDAIANKVDLYNLYIGGGLGYQYEYLTRDFEKLVTEIKKQGLQGARTFDDTAFMYYETLTYYYHFLNDTINLRIYADSMRQIIESNMNIVFNRTAGDSYNKESLSLAYFCLGNKEKGLQLLNEAAESRFIDKDGVNAPWVYLWQSTKYIMMGEHEKGLDMIEYLLSRSSPLTVAYLKVSVFFDPLRDHPRFQALLEKYEKEHGI